MYAIERRSGADRRIVEATPLVDRRHGGDRRNHPSLRVPEEHSPDRRSPPPPQAPSWRLRDTTADD